MVKCKIEYLNASKEIGELKSKMNGVLHFPKPVFPVTRASVVEITSDLTRFRKYEAYQNSKVYGFYNEEIVSELEIILEHTIHWESEAFIEQDNDYQNPEPLYIVTKGRMYLIAGMILGRDQKNE
jgi:hypothetical protein